MTHEIAQHCVDFNCTFSFVSIVDDISWATHNHFVFKCINIASLPTAEKKINHTPTSTRNLLVGRSTANEKREKQQQPHRHSKQRVRLFAFPELKPPTNRSKHYGIDPVVVLFFQQQEEKWKRERIFPQIDCRHLFWHRQSNEALSHK